MCVCVCVHTYINFPPGETIHTRLRGEASRVRSHPTIIVLCPVCAECCLLIDFVCVHVHYLAVSMTIGI